MNFQKKRLQLLSILLLLLVAGLYLSMIKGSVETSFTDLVDFLIHSDQTHAKIFIHLRLSRALLAFLVGASLSLSGVILQGYFQNPMAGPFVVGVSSGASFGAVLALFLGLNLSLLGFSAQSLFAFGSGFAIVSLVYLLSQRKGVFKVETLLLTGIAAGALASSLTSFLIFFKSESFEQAIFWLLGSFQLADWNQIRVVFFYLLFCFFLSQWFAKDMNLLVLGDETAQSLGCPVNRVRRIYLAVSTLLAASAVSVSGIIGFVGLIVPHWVRILIGPDHRFLFFYSSLVGGIFLMFCDLLARTILPGSELPIGIITAIVGAPFFIYLLNQQR
ncbi:MAG: iron ABC transporter permease [Candidatus Aminicenantes bacterium]|nr:iron ABC transporter permease [Candidatus Aminicenantes bacterium]MDH5383381.1 iron ABC transporter permease [Candidatus Aminicenantes bacterium]